MVSWNIAIVLVLLAFALPFVLLHVQLEQRRQRQRRDFTEKEYLRRMLRDTEAHVRNDKALFLEALGVPFLLVKPTGRLVMANRYAGDVLGVDVQKCPNLLKILPDGALRSLLQEVLQTPQPSTQSLTLTVQGEERFYLLTSTPLGNADKHIGLVLHDVTNEQRTQMIRRDFVANASHELRTPLTIMRGYLENLLENPEDAADAALRSRALGIMSKHVERISRLVEDMLTISRLESMQSLQLECGEFDLAQEVHEVAQRLERMIVQQQAQLTISMLPEPFRIRGDRFYWSQIIFNLLENSLKNNPASGVHIHVSAARQADGSAAISVQDNGVGIAEDALPFIFNRFYRADKSGLIKGTGLGLSIVRHAVEAHGGTISVASEPGVRTVFTIVLPASALCI